MARLSEGRAVFSKIHAGIARLYGAYQKSKAVLEGLPIREE
jgi:hypothetical protein